MDTECDVCHATRSVVGAEAGNDGKVYINVNLKEGEEVFGAIWLVDAYGNYYPVVRVGFQGGTSSAANKFEVIGAPADLDLAACEIIANIDTPTMEKPNITSVGVSLSQQFTGLRFVSRFTRVEEAGKELMVLDGQKYEVLDYGVIVASESGMKVDLGAGFTLQQARDAMVVGETLKWTDVVSFKEAGVLYDNCDAYIDMALTFTNIKNASIDYYTRSYVTVQDGDQEVTLYGDFAYGDFAYYNG